MSRTLDQLATLAIATAHGPVTPIITVTELDVVRRAQGDRSVGPCGHVHSEWQKALVRNGLEEEGLVASFMVVDPAKGVG